MPIERFSPDIDIESLKGLVETVCQNSGGLVAINDGEDEQTLETYSVYIVGTTKQNAFPVTLIGNAVEATGDIEAIGTIRRLHMLVASQEIIDSVKECVSRISSK